MVVSVHKRGEGAVRLRFVRNTTYDGAEYGPDYAEDTVVVDWSLAAGFLTRGAAVRASEPAGGDEEGEEPAAPKKKRAPRKRTSR